METGHKERKRFEALEGQSAASMLVACQLVLCLWRDTAVVTMADGFVHTIMLIGGALSVWVVMGLRRFAEMRGIKGPFGLWAVAAGVGFLLQAFDIMLPALHSQIMSHTWGVAVWLTLEGAVQLVWVAALVCLGYGLYVQRHDFYGDLFMALAVAWALCLVVVGLSLSGVLGMRSLVLQGGLLLVYNFINALCFVSFYLLLRRTD